MYLSDPKIPYFCTRPPYPCKLFPWAGHETPIGSRIPIPLPNLEIKVVFFLEFRCQKVIKLEFQFQNLDFRIFLCRNSVHLILY